MSSCAERNGNFFTGQLASRVFVDFQGGGNNAVVVVRIAYRNVDDLKVLATRCRNNERRQTLRHSDLNITGCHSRAHRCAGFKRNPVHFHAQRFVVGTGCFCCEEWHWPFEEVTDGDFTVAIGHCGLTGHRHYGAGYKSCCCLLDHNNLPVDLLSGLSKPVC